MDITVLNGVKKIGNSIPIKKILSQNFFGVYTACRTFNQTKIFEFENNLKRLSDANKITPIDIENKKVEISSKRNAFQCNEVESYISPSLKLAMKEMIESLPPNAEMRIYMILTPKWEQWIEEIKDKNVPFVPLSSFDVLIRVEQLPDPPKGPAQVEIRKIGGRENPTSKHSSWIKQSEEYLQKKGEKIEEVLLSDENQNIYEGISSNFFAIQKTPLSLITAPQDKVLQGTVAQVVKDYCHKFNFPLLYQFPNFDDHSNWSCAFITSTSRQILDVSNFHLIDKNDQISTSFFVDSSNCDILKQIQQHYKLFIEHNSTQIL